MLSKYMKSAALITIKMLNIIVLHLNKAFIKNKTCAKHRKYVTPTRLTSQHRDATFSSHITIDKV